MKDLEHLRRLQIQGSTPLPVFMQLKQVFHVLESLASARIEGNHTTLADYVEARVIDRPNLPEQVQEIANIERAMQQVEYNVDPDASVTEHLLRSLHATTVDGLTREGDTNPGAYRQSAVKIAQAEHLPPEAPQVPDYMTELWSSSTGRTRQRYDLMKVALAHHRFAWVQPFGNANGRVVRLLTYAMLIKYGFRLNAVDWLLNPAAVFCADRNAYHARLGDAEAGTDEALERWCVYVLSGVRDELTEVDSLADYEHIKAKFLLPAGKYARAVANYPAGTGGVRHHRQGRYGESGRPESRHARTQRELIFAARCTAKGRHGARHCRGR